jgi:hypothetical protein
MDNRLKIIIPEQYIKNNALDLEGFAKYLQTPKNTIDFEYEKEFDKNKNLKNWFKDIIVLTKWYLNLL